MHFLISLRKCGNSSASKSDDFYSWWIYRSGKVDTIINAKPAIYFATERNDSYYGSRSVSETYQKLYELYRKKGLSKEEIDAVLVLDLKDNDYFTRRGYADTHAGGGSFAKDTAIMGWLFKSR